MKVLIQLIKSGLSRFWAIAGAVSVRTKILGIALSLVLLLGVVAILVVRASVTSVVRQELELSAVSIAENLATRVTDAILVNNQYLLYQLITEAKTNYTDLRYVFVVDSKGNILAHTFGVGFPPALLTANGISSGNFSRVVILTTTEGLVWDVAAPIFNGRVGTLRLGLTDGLLVRSVNVVTTQLLLATLLVSTLGILFAILLTRLLTHPLQQLARAAHAVGQGDLEQQVTRWADDEIGELADSFNAMVVNLKLAAEAHLERNRLRSELVERIIAAQEEERKRIACDLHDQTSQALVSLIVQLKLVETAPNAAARRKNLEALREQLRSALGEVRQMALDLRPNVLDDLGLEQAIRWFAERCSQNSNLTVKVTCQGDLSNLPERYTITIYRVVQESLSNVVKHSHARHAQVDVRFQPGRLSLCITDDGQGFSALSEGETRGSGSLGIVGMQERIALLGGQLSIQSEIDRGTIVQADIPVSYIQVNHEKDPATVEIPQ